ncbi:MAG: ATP-binding cassette domain-containing protein [Gammaproteobacteria bacterium]|nr:ATP-binding cassette domain-containing protein [Gammaproteobacteria bacterium]
MTAALEAVAVVAGYHAPVVGPVTFSLSDSEVVGLWGPNGCGKSTLLRAVVGAARVFEGDVRRRPSGTVAYLDQHPVRLPEAPIRGREVLALTGAGGATPPERLSPWLERRVDRLSGGQFQLLNAWACLAGDAGLVLLDEPTNNLDPDGEALLVELLRRRPEGRAVLLVSHERPFLDQVADRVLDLG